MERLARGYSLFINWFNGVCAIACGGYMALSAVVSLPFGWQDFMPLSVYDAFPLHDVFFTSHFWPGIALMLVNGAPNLIALVRRFQKRAEAWKAWCLAAGILLVLWTAVEMILIPNPASVLYMVLGALQTLAALCLLRRQA